MKNFNPLDFEVCEDTLCLNLNFELPHLNEELRRAKGHWAAYSQTKKKIDKKIKTTFATQLPPNFQTLTHKVNILFIWRCKDRRKDKDNICFAKKYILDSLQPRILKNDGWGEVGDFCDRFVVSKVVGVDIYLIPIKK